jgi:hypothetical protein
LVDTADELLAFVQRHRLMESAALQFNAMTVDGNTARFWRAYQLAREAGGSVPEPLLRVLDDVAARLLAAGASDDDRLRAIGFPRRKRGQSSLAALAQEPRQYELCSMLWLEATGGTAGREPPTPLPAGVYAAVARRLGVELDAARKARWKTEWRRFRMRWNASRGEREQMSEALQKVLLAWGGDRR